MTFSGYHMIALYYAYINGMFASILVKIIMIPLAIFVLVSTFLYSFCPVIAAIDIFSSTKKSEQAQEILTRSSNLALKNPFLTLKFF